MQTFCGITTDGMLDYLAAIYKLGNRGERVTTSALSERMNVSAAAASSMLKRLEESNFIERSALEGITLTEQGRLAALQLIRRHRLLEVFLIQVLGYTWDQVDNDAHRLEHAISAAFEARMDKLCNYPTHCPHGDPIPRKDGTLPEAVKLVALTQLRPGQGGTLRRIGLTDSRVLRYLSQLQLIPGQTIRLQDVAPFKGPVTVALISPTANLEQPQIQAMGHELAEQIFVTPHELDPSTHATRMTATSSDDEFDLAAITTARQLS